MSRAQVLSFAALFSVAVGLFAVAASCTAQDGEAEFSNVEILTEVTDKREMRAIMKEQAKALGVKCTYCHVQGKFELDDKPEKKQAREMMRMVRELNRTWFKDSEKPITCWTCHRGSDHPEMERPEGAGGPPPGFQAADGE